MKEGYSEPKLNRVLKRIKFAFLAITSCSLLLGCSPTPQETTKISKNINATSLIISRKEVRKKPVFKEINDSISIDEELIETIGEAGVDTLVNTFEEFKNKYGCPFRIFFVAESMPVDVLEHNRYRTILGYSIPQQITLNSNVPPRSFYPETLPDLFRDTVFHETAHTCVPKNLKVDTSKLLENENFEILGYSGFVIEYKQIEAFHYIEEGYAEAMGYSTYKNYKGGGDERYERVAKLMVAIIEKWSTPKEIAELHRKSDLIGLVSVISGKENPTKEDLSMVMEYFRKAWDGETEGLWEKIEANRYK